MNAEDDGDVADSDDEVFLDEEGGSGFLIEIEIALDAIVLSTFLSLALPFDGGGGGGGGPVLLELRISTPSEPPLFSRSRDPFLSFLDDDCFFFPSLESDELPLEIYRIYNTTPTKIATAPIAMPEMAPAVS